jgi:hypothetical protein
VPRGPGRRPHDDAVVAPRPSPSAARSLVDVGLAALVLGVPLAVLPSASGPYDDPKVWALPILVGLTGLAWVAEGRRAVAPGPLDPTGRRLGVLVLVGLGWALFTTVLSVAPPQSVLGIFGRGTGLLIFATATALFFLIRPRVRTARGVRSLVDVTLLGSVPVCLVALGQALGWDPLPQPWDPAVTPMTVRSTLGSHVFLGSYLIMIMPFAAARLEWAYRERASAGASAAPSAVRWLSILVATVWVAGAVAVIGLAPRWPWLWWALVPWGVIGALARSWTSDRVGDTTDTRLTVACVALLLAAQVAVVVLSRGRGAFIAMVVGLGAAVLGSLLMRRAWKTLTLAVLAVCGLAVFLVLLNTPGSAVSRLGEMPLLRRLSTIGDVQYGTPGWVRLQVWKAIADGWRGQLDGEEVISGRSPRVRSLIGYGPETQLLVLEPLTTSFLVGLTARGQGWRARYVFDRSHNVLLDYVVTQGLVGAGLWILMLAGLLAVGVARLRGSPAGEAAMRLGALGTLLAHLADGQVGMQTPIAMALFWISAAILVMPHWSGAPEPSKGRDRPPISNHRVWVALLAANVVVVVLVAWIGTRWLLASVAYADGTRHGIAGRLNEAHEDFRRAIALTPWLLLPAEAGAYTVLRLGGMETDPSRRLALYREGQAMLTRARRYAVGGADSWALTGQLAFAEARMEGRGDLSRSRDAFATALRSRPDDPRLIAQSGLISLEGGDAVAGREAARRALAGDRRDWMAWALLARASRQLGEIAEAERAARAARTLAPPEAQRLLQSVLPDLQRP